MVDFILEREEDHGIFLWEDGDLDTKRSLKRLQLPSLPLEPGHSVTDFSQRPHGRINTGVAVSTRALPFAVKCGIEHSSSERAVDRLTELPSYGLTEGSIISLTGSLLLF